MPEPYPWKFCPACGLGLILIHDGDQIRPHCNDCQRFYYHNPAPAACCFIARGKDELLFAQRAVEPCKGEWTLPGGFVELEETTEEAALRELLEETNLRGTKARLLGASTKQSPTHGGILVLGYIIDDWEGEETMRPDSDALDLRFFSKAERPSVPFSAHRDLLALYDALQP